jgi:DNA-directed RNA polymerase subunit RPC12/RpoP
MAERTADEQLCPHCGSRQTHSAGKIGGRMVGRCSRCARTFWREDKGGSIIRAIKGLLLGMRARGA